MNTSSRNSLAPKWQQAMQMLLALLLAGSATFAIGQDLDVESARRAYDEAKRRADQARSALFQEEQRFRPYEDRYRQAQQNLNQLENNLEQARRNLEDVRSRLDRVNQIIDNGQNDLENLRRQKDSLQARLDQLKNKRENQQTRVAEIEQRLADVNAKIQAAEAAGNTEEVARLRVRRDEIQGNLQEVRGNLQQTQQEINQTKNDLDRLQNQIDAKKREIDDAQARKPQLQAERDRYKSQVDQLHFDVQGARDHLRQRESEMESARSNLTAAQQNKQRAESDEQSALRYYQQVQANYNRARDNAIATGRNAGVRDGASEADVRASPAGSRDGDAHAQQLGRHSGDSEAREISKVRGYQRGRAEASQNSSLNGPYRQGIGQGQTMAVDKAKLEDFPRGFNQALDSFLASEPAQQDTIDISDAISGDAGDQSHLMRIGRKPAQTGVTPSFPDMREPAYRLPTASAPSVSAPSPDRSQYRAPCTGLELREFDRLCADSYDSAYPTGFRDQYVSVYRRFFQSEFNSRIRGYYDQARGVNYPAETDSGLKLGAQHQGVLDGFAGHLAQARQDQFQAGVSELERQSSIGYYLVLKSMSVVGEREDGIISPGEQLKLKVRIDNIGSQSTPREKIRVSIIQSNGLVARVNTRLLPSLAADTATTLEGVIPASVATEIVNNKIQLSVKLESEKSPGQFEQIGTLALSEDVHFPIELVDVTFDQALVVGQPARAMLTFKNLTNQAFQETPVSLSAYPQNVALSQSQFELPPIEAGESISLPIDVTPDVTAGSNLMTRIKADLQGIYGVASMIQSRDHRLSVKRNGSLNLCLQSGCDANIALPLQVRAGTEVSFPISFKFQSTVRQNGPFIIEKEAVSSTRITAGNNSVLKATLGAWGPGSSPYRGNFIYKIPADLAGQDHWIKVRLTEANKNIHSIMIPFKVQ